MERSNAYYAVRSIVRAVSMVLAIAVGLLIADACIWVLWACLG